MAAINARDISSVPLDAAKKEAMRYAETLTNSPKELRQADVQTLRDAGFVDGEILEINQVTAYFSYANRTVLGLGCSADGEILGLSPSTTDNPDDWSHA